MYISREAKAITSICLLPPPPPPPLLLLAPLLLLLLVGRGAQREGCEHGQESWPGGWKAERAGNAARTRKPRRVSIALAVSVGPPPWGTAARALLRRSGRPGARP